MDVGLVTILLFSSLFILLLTGLPLAFCLGVVALIFTYFLWGSAAVMQVASACFGATMNIILIACPLFIFMANVLQFSGLADRLYDMIYTWSGRISGGLAMGTVFICAVFAAMSGISGAATVSMGIIAIPSMLTRKYDKFLSVGCVAAGGALGILIPPSITMIVYASMTGVSVGQLFMAGVLPGMLLAGMFIVYIAVRCLISPELGPPLPPEERRDWPEKFKSLGAVVLPLILVLSVIGSILLGLATPTEAAAVGAVGSLVCAALNRKLGWKSFIEASRKSLVLTCMIIWIVVTATAFSNIYTAVGAPDFLNGLLESLGVGRWSVLLMIQITYFFLGMVMDPIGIVMITTPVYIPIIKALGFDPIWFGILFIINMEMAYLTPPFGYNLFYMRSIVPAEAMSMRDLYVSVLPFILIQAICLATIMLLPTIALWLPNLLEGGV
jgi:tripartite ATP-independent transporter DctM subunit